MDAGKEHDCRGNPDDAAHEMHTDPGGAQAAIPAHFKRQQKGKGECDDIAQEDDLDRGIMIHQAFGQPVIDAKSRHPAAHRHDTGKVVLA